MSNEKTIKKRLLVLKKRLEKGEKFSRLARQFSDDSLSAAKGGDLGWLAANATVPEFAERLVEAKPKTIVGPFETRFGWHLLEVRKVREAKSDIDEIYRRAEGAIRREKAYAEIRRWQAHLRNTRVVRIIEDK